MSDDAQAPEDQDVGQDEDLETDQEEEQAEPPKGKLGGKLKYIIMGVVALLIVGGGAGAYFMGLFHIDKPHETTLELPGPPVFHELARITVDLKPEPGRARPFIRVTFNAELENEAAKQALINNEIKISDQIRTHLRSVSPSDITGEVGTERLRTDLTTIINKVIAPEHCITVLYKDIMVR